MSLTVALGVGVSVSVGDAVKVDVGGTRAVGEKDGVRLGLAVEDGVFVAVVVTVILGGAVAPIVPVGVAVILPASGAKASAIAPMQ